MHQDIVGNDARHTLRRHLLETFVAEKAAPEHGGGIGLDGQLAQNLPDLVLDTVFPKDDHPSRVASPCEVTFFCEDHAPLFFRLSQKSPIRLPPVIDRVITQESQPL